jgi:uroporphyrinogen decarboxylase
MTKRDRVLATVAGASTDRPPYSFWYHFPGGDRADEAFVRNEVEFALRFDVDLLKVMHDAPFDLPDGALTVDSPAAFAQIPAIEPTAGHFGRHLEALRAIRDRLPDGRPMVDTLFDPYAYGEKITGKRLLEFLAADPEATRAGLQSVTDSLVRWAETCLTVVDGVYLACGAASESMLSRAVYETEILPLDVQVMEAAMAVGPLNVIHVHGAGAIHFDLLARCPCHILSWGDRTTDVSIGDARERVPETCLAAGIDEVTAGDVSPAEMAAQVEDAIRQSGGSHLLVACGCAVPTDTPLPVLEAIGAATKRAGTA